MRQIDVRAELEKYDWTRPRWSSDKLIAASPFRYDKSPSFFVRLEQHGDYPAGTWSDSGAYDAEWRSGNFVKLLSFLRNESYEETDDYLTAAYGVFESGDDTIKLPPIRIRIQRGRQSLNADLLTQYSECPAYLTGRGISEEVQRQAGVRYDAQSRAVVLPWYLPDGRLANVKYRQTRGKVFWYHRGAWPIRELVYGLRLAQKLTVICEAEIDALSFMQAGFAAVAVGGASFNEAKRDLILRSPIEELVIAVDNDKAGGKLRSEIEQHLKGRVNLRNAYVPGDVKDANEALVKYGGEALRDAVEKSETCRGLYLNLRTTAQGKRA